MESKKMNNNELSNESSTANIQRSKLKAQQPVAPICALATPPGGAIGVVRVSGERAIETTGNIFRGRAKKPLTDAKGNTLHYGEVVDKDGTTIDDVLVSVFRAPHSYTGEDSTEISCHGSAYIINQIVRTLIEAGCRQAQPGEFTQRAYLNGKMDLSQAEAVADLIAASNRASHQVAMSQLKGHFSSELSQLRDQLLKITSLLELELDFADHEELQFADRTELKTLAERIHQHITKLTRSFKTGNAIKKGIPVAIAGKTNVGKSTLLNHLIHEERAIVSDIHGTTRDVIEDTTDINGISFRFIDTAGIRPTDDKIEQLGIERAYQKIGEARIVLWIIDTQPTDDEISDMQQRCADKPLIIVRNKMDQLSTDNHQPTTGNAHDSEPSTLLAPCPIAHCPLPVIPLSAKFGWGIRKLEQAIYDAADIPTISENSVIVTSARHYDALIRADESIIRVIDGLASSLPADLISEDLRLCLAHLADITGGQITPTEVLGNIFKHFCIGK